MLVLVLPACRSAGKKGSGQDGYNQMIRSQQQSLAIEQMQQPAVYFHGPLQKPIVPWRENLSLAEALLEAGYTSPFSPHSIRVMRQGRTYNIDVQRMLRGTDNPALLPGDVVEVAR
jgi:hypothetical protein